MRDRRGRSRIAACRPRIAGRRLHQRVEHRLQIEGRAADDLEHVGGGGLLLQRFAQLVEQPRVLDGDDGLSGEVSDQIDLFFSKGPNFLPVNYDCANQPVVLEHGHSELRPRATEFGLWGGTRRFQHINCVNYLPRSAQHIEV